MAEDTTKPHVLKDYFFCGGQIYGVKEELVHRPKRPILQVCSLKALQSLARVVERAPVTAIR